MSGLSNTLAGLTVEKAAMLLNRFAIATAKGVLLVITLDGITGYSAHLDSTNMNRTPEIPPAHSSPIMMGLFQGNSSAVFRLSATREHPTAPTSVRLPSQSILRSF